MPRPALFARLRRSSRRPSIGVHIVGHDAPVVAGLRAAGVEVLPTPVGADAVVVLDPTVSPAKLEREPLRIGVVGRGDGSSWSTSDVVEDVDALLALTHDDAGSVAHRAVLPPRVTAEAGWAVRDLVGDLRRRPRLHLITGVSNLRMRPRWGDHHYAIAIAKALGRRGWLTRSWCQAEFPDIDHSAADAVLLLAGGVELRRIADRPTIAWVIYPRDLDMGSVKELDHVHVASPLVARRLAAAGVSASVLHQATDIARFRPTPGGRHHELLYVANSRNVRRRVPDDLLPTPHEFAIYGFGWTPELVDDRHVVAEHVPNAELPALYTAADIVLNDHWDAMRSDGYLANRLFDAAACGATVVTDEVQGLDRVFGGAVRGYASPGGLHRIIDELLADPGLRNELGDQARDVVLRSHTFEHRAEALLASLPAQVSA